jgi:putative phage-type endonuclease
MKVINHPQGSPEWLAARLGKVTASRIGDVIAKGRDGGASKTRAAYMGELIGEILTGQSCAAFKGNDDTERGQETEPAARVAYEVTKRVMVDECGLVIHPRIERSGASPDGLVDDDGLLEIKCPRIHIHLDYLMSGAPPSVYIPQMAWQAACTERKWVDFVSYCPLMPDDLRLFVVRYIPTEKYIAQLEQAVHDFLGELDAKLRQITQLRSPDGVADLLQQSIDRTKEAA